MCGLPLEKLPMAAISRCGAHFSCSSSAAKIRRRFGAAGQLDGPCAPNVSSAFEKLKLVELERYGGKEQPGAQSSVRVRNITNRCCVLSQCTTLHMSLTENESQAGGYAVSPEKT